MHHGGKASPGHGSEATVPGSAPLLLPDHGKPKPLILLYWRVHDTQHNDNQHNGLNCEPK